MHTMTCPICDTEFPYAYCGQGAALAACPCGRYHFSQHLYGCIETVDEEQIEFYIGGRWFRTEEEIEAKNKAAAEQLEKAVAAARQKFLPAKIESDPSPS